MVPVSQQTLRCCILLLTAGGAYKQTVRRAGREEANHTAAGREGPALTQPPLRCLLKSNIAVVLLTHYDATTPAEQLDCSSFVGTHFTTVT